VNQTKFDNKLFENKVKILIFEPTVFQFVIY